LGAQEAAAEPKTILSVRAQPQQAPESLTV
jgi:hypothetical protein